MITIRENIYNRIKEKAYPNFYSPSSTSPPPTPLKNSSYYIEICVSLTCLALLSMCVLYFFVVRHFNSGTTKDSFPCEINILYMRKPPYNPYFSTVDENILQTQTNTADAVNYEAIRTTFVWILRRTPFY